VPRTPRQSDAHDGAALRGGTDLEHAAHGFDRPAHDLKAEAGVALARAAGGRLDSRSTIGHRQPDRVAVAVGSDCDAEPGALRRVREHVVDEHVDDVAKVDGVELHGCRLRREIDPQVASLVLGQWGPERHALAHDCNRVAAGGHLVAHRSPGVAHDRVDAALQVADMLTQPLAEGLVRHSFHVDPKRGDGGAEPVGQVADSGALGREQLGDPLGQPVECLGERLGLGRSLDRRPGVELALTEPVGDLRDARHRGADPAGELHGDDGGEKEQEHAESDDGRPGVRDASVQLGVGHLRHHHVGAVAGDHRYDGPGAVIGPARERRARLRFHDVRVARTDRPAAQRRAVGEHDRGRGR
jgi:hypothetical protein